MIKYSYNPAVKSNNMACVYFTNTRRTIKKYFLTDLVTCKIQQILRQGGRWGRNYLTVYTLHDQTSPQNKSLPGLTLSQTGEKLTSAKDSLLKKPCPRYVRDFSLFLSYNLSQLYYEICTIASFHYQLIRCIRPA